MSRPSEIYAFQLERLGLGHALWCPEGPSGSNDVTVGSVGYIEDGTFYELFNASYPASHERNTGKSVPPGHEPSDLDGFVVSQGSFNRLPSIFTSDGVHCLQQDFSIDR